MNKKDTNEKVTKKNEETTKVRKEPRYVVNEPSFFQKYGAYLGVFAVGILLGVFGMYLARYNEIAKLANGEEIVAKVKGKDFTADTLFDKLKEDYGSSALVELVDSELLNKQYTDEQVKEKVDAEIAYYKQYYGDKWETTIKNSTYKTEAAFRKVIGLSYKQELAVLDVEKGKLEEKEIQKYYDETVKPDIKISHIIIQSEASSSATEEDKKKAKEEAKKKAEDLLKQIKKEKNAEKRLELFAKLAKENSMDGTKDNGGDLGYISYDEDFDKAFLAAAYTLKNEVGAYTTSVVESEFGYHIIIKTEKDKEKVKLEEIKDKIKDVLAKEKIDKKPELKVSNMDKFRKDNGLTFQDQVLKRVYEDYITSSIASIQAQQQQQQAA